jgi:hypothetical protein
VRRLLALVLSVQVVTFSSVSAAPPAIPFPAALDAAAVRQDRIHDIARRALVLGNGDLNALLWERAGALRMRVTKNDLRDARIDTSQDPPLLQMDIRRRTWKGGTGAPASWRKHPYPQPRCAAVVTIGQTTPGALTPARAAGGCVSEDGPPAALSRPQPPSVAVTFTSRTACFGSMFCT